MSNNRTSVEALAIGIAISVVLVPLVTWAILDGSLSTGVGTSPAKAVSSDRPSEPAPAAAMEAGRETETPSTASMGSIGSPLSGSRKQMQAAVRQYLRDNLGEPEWEEIEWKWGKSFHPSMELRRPDADSSRLHEPFAWLKYRHMEHGGRVVTEEAFFVRDGRVFYSTRFVGHLSVFE